MMDTYHQGLPATTVRALKLLKPIQRQAPLLIALALLIPVACLLTSLVAEVTAPFQANVEVARAVGR